MMIQKFVLSMGMVALGSLLVASPADGFSFRSFQRNISRVSFRAQNPSRDSGDRSSASEYKTTHSSPKDADKSSTLIATSSRRSLMIRGIRLASAAVLVSNPGAASAGIDVSGLRVEGTPPPLTSPPAPAPRNPENVIELAGIQYTPAAMILQMAEQTASMEGMMRASASDIMAKKSRTERVEAGSKGTGPGVVTRNNLTQSVGIMVKNSRVATIAPQAATTLETIPEYLSGKPPTIDMTFDEYLTVAKKYEQAREDLRIAFEAMSEEDQQEGRQIVRAIRRRDAERMAAMQREQRRR